MKKIKLYLLLLGVVGLGVLSAPKAFAHILRVDNEIAVVLHTDPDDNPISGVSTTYIFYFSDITGRFQLSSCYCRVNISSPGTNDYTANLVDSGPLTSTNKHVFPKPGYYNIVVTGQPVSKNGFQPFSVSWSVKWSGIYRKPFPVLLTILITLGVAIIVTAAYFASRGSKGLKSGQE